MGCRCNPPVEVTLYADPTSREGREARDYFESKGVQFDNFDVTADAAALRQMRVLSGQTEHPVIVLDGQVLVGCDPATLDPKMPTRF